MQKYYCTKCQDTCEYMCERTVVCVAQPMTIDGTPTCKAYDDSKSTEGSICILCGERLPLKPKDYIVEVTVVEGDEYVKTIDVWEIRKRENACNR